MVSATPASQLDTAAVDIKKTDEAVTAICRILLDQTLNRRERQVTLLTVIKRLALDTADITAHQSREIQDIILDVYCDAVPQ